MLPSNAVQASAIVCIADQGDAHLGLDCETLAQQVALSQFCHQLVSGQNPPVPFGQPTPDITPNVSAYAAWHVVWSAEETDARSERRPMRLILWHDTHSKVEGESQGVPIPFTLVSPAVNALVR